ncbi:MAG TPA: ATP-binding protein [Burkholderiales bacterium]|nr:ATP-binding protein [Burkholderiales bacterium]
MSVARLSAEWERIDLLGACLAQSRRGESVPDPAKDRLRQLQGELHALRSDAPWTPLARDYGLSWLDQDILACALAPEAEPRLGWMYQELQPGLGSAYPTPALIRELFFMEGKDAEALVARLDDAAPLKRSRLVEHGVEGSFAPLRAGAQAQARLLGWSAPSAAPPGAMEVRCQARWDDLVLPAACRRALEEYVFWITHRSRVEDEWGARLPGGPVALFAGPSGTGKSLAAEVIAGTLGRRLYRVDLGMLVSKYIGETEKNLNALFDAAEGREMVLLFDEADSLFGRRGDVREARDRYANMEVSHLLARVERHRGPCILTTNLRQHLDPAFARRFQAVVEFPRPDAPARAALWRCGFPPRAPLAAEVEPQALAAGLELTGAQIRNAALHAAFLAAAADAPIGLAHVAAAVLGELAKDGREVPRSSLGMLSEHLPEEAA